MGNLRPVIWQEAFIKAVDEPDRETLARLIREAEMAIVQRRLQLENPANYRDEVRAMKLATLAMDSIKAQKLGGVMNQKLLKDCCSLQRSAWAIGCRGSAPQFTLLSPSSANNNSPAQIVREPGFAYARFLVKFSDQR